MECFKIFRCIDQDNDHSGMIPLHKLIQFILDSICKTCRMFNNQIFSRKFISYRADSAFI